MMTVSSEIIATAFVFCFAPDTQIAFIVPDMHRTGKADTIHRR